MPARVSRLQDPLQRVVVGPEQRRDARVALGLGDAFVARDRRRFADRRDRGGHVGRPVAVDHQARIGLGDERRIEGGGQSARDRLDPDVVGDVALEVLGREAEVAERARHAPAGVIAGEHERRIAVRPLDVNGRRLVGLEQGHLRASFWSGRVAHQHADHQPECQGVRQGPHGPWASGTGSAIHLHMREPRIWPSGTWRLFTCIITYKLAKLERPARSWGVDDRTPQPPSRRLHAESDGASCAAEKRTSRVPVRWTEAQTAATELMRADAERTQANAPRAHSTNGLSNEPERANAERTQGECTPSAPANGLPN